MSGKDQVKRQRNKESAGRASKEPRTEKGGREIGGLSTAFERDMVPIPRKESEEGKDGEEEKVVEGPSIDRE